MGEEILEKNKLKGKLKKKKNAFLLIFLVHQWGW